jgi:uncharacterized membrane protein
MRNLGLIAATSTLLAACGSRDDGPAPPANEAAAPAAAAAEAPPAAAEPSATSPAGRWDLQSSGEGTALALLAGSGPAAIRLFCPVRQRQLLVNVPGFRPIGSEERLSFGSGATVAALVADTRGDPRRGGVSGTGAVPVNLAALIGGPISASYGAQTSGPHPAPPANLARLFAGACDERLSVPSPAPGGAAKPAPGPGGPCSVQDGKALAVAPLRAVGTEPFWAAQIQGRCVTYSHPEDQKGTRVWTRFTAAPGGGTWSGTLGGKPFELRIRPQRGCSDGMSDRRYPLAVELRVGAERRSGCAAPV